MQIVLIFGSTGSLGSELVKSFLNKGYFVIWISKSLDTYKHKNYLSLLGDVLDVLFMEKIKEEIWWMQIELIITTIGLYSAKKISHCTFNDIQNMVDVNLVSNMYISKLILSLWKSVEWSTFIYLSSSGKWKIKQNNSLYSSTKMALSVFMDCLSCEIEERWIKIIEFSPWPFQSKIFEKGGSFVEDNFNLPTPTKIAEILMSTYFSSSRNSIAKIILHRNF